MLGPNLLLPGISLGQGELPLLLGEEPLFTGLVGAGVGGHVVSELAASHNLSRTAADIPERCVSVV